MDIFPILLRVFFVFSQTIIAAYFIFKAVEDWNENPIVTSGMFYWYRKTNKKQGLLFNGLNRSVKWHHKIGRNLNFCVLLCILKPISFLVSFGDISEVPFPAVSICHPKSWKWPGLIKAITHYDTYGDAFFIIKKLNMYENASQRLSSIKAMRLMNEEFLGEERVLSFRQLLFD